MFKADALDLPASILNVKNGRDPIDRVRDLSISRPIKAERSSVIERQPINRGRDQSGPYRF